MVFGDRSDFDLDLSQVEGLYEDFQSGEPIEKTFRGEKIEDF